MKASELIAFVDAVKPNAFSYKMKISWLNEVEGMVWTDIMLRHPASFVSYKVDEDVELSTKPPHAKIYSTYLSAMIDYHNGEYDKYETTKALFNECFGNYMRWYANEFSPADNLEESETEYVNI